MPDEHLAPQQPDVTPDIAPSPQPPSDPTEAKMRAELDEKKRTLLSVFDNDERVISQVVNAYRAAYEEGRAVNKANGQAGYAEEGMKVTDDKFGNSMTTLGFNLSPDELFGFSGFMYDYTVRTDGLASYLSERSGPTQIAQSAHAAPEPQQAPAPLRSSALVDQAIHDAFSPPKGR